MTEMFHAIGYNVLIRPVDPKTESLTFPPENETWTVLHFGVIVSTGADVNKLRPGDRVLYSI